MDNKLTVTAQAEVISEEQEFFTEQQKENVQKARRASKSESTRRCYEWQFAAFRSWCEENHHSALPATPATVGAYIGELMAAQKSASMVNQALAAIKAFHRDENLPSPTNDDRLKETAIGIRHLLGTAPQKKAAISPTMLRNMIDKLNLKSIRGLRDRAVLLVGFSGAFRRSELAALNLSDLQAVEDDAGRRAYIITVRRSKTDQEGQGMQKGIFTAVKDKKLDAVKAIEEYIAAAGITSGALFRQIRRGSHVQADRLTGESIATIVKDAAQRAGIVLNISGHSLRAGFITTALSAGASERSVMNQSGHRSVMVMRGYQRRVDVLKDNAAAGLL